MMDKTTECPKCGFKGFIISYEDEFWRMCTSPGCEAVYYTNIDYKKNCDMAATIHLTRERIDVDWPPPESVINDPDHPRVWDWQAADYLDITYPGVRQAVRENLDIQQPLIEEYNRGYGDGLKGSGIPSLTHIEGLDNQGHYRDHGGIEAISYIVANDLNFCEGCVVKYVTRWRKKGGIDDLRKAQQYILWLIEAAEQE
jgi:hypothetical protein